MTERTGGTGSRTPTKPAGAATWRLRNVPLPVPHLFGIAAGEALRRLRPWTWPANRPARRLVGYALLGAGGSLIARSLLAAGQVPLDAPDRLVANGPYALSRNPMYVGWALIHLGCGIAAGSGWVLATLPVAAVRVHRGVLREEQQLADKFDSEFERYRSAVPRYLRTPHARR